ncbi:MAG: gamma-glutamyltransferase [Rhodopseudomonas palustris]|nr:gamma-glutamyltransferase [Rhodopseudomonas palustris]
MPAGNRRGPRSWRSFQIAQHAARTPERRSPPRNPEQPQSTPDGPALTIARWRPPPRSRAPGPTRTPLEPVRARCDSGANGVVAAAKPDASRAGVQILKMGGNAVDAAVATGLRPRRPRAERLGHRRRRLHGRSSWPAMKEAVVIDFRADGAGGRDRRTCSSSTSGGRADRQRLASKAAWRRRVPGEVQGLLYALDHFGSKKLSRAQVVAARHRLGRDAAYPSRSTSRSIIKDNFGKLSTFEHGLAIYAKDGLPPRSRRHDRQQATWPHTLRLIQARGGTDAIYTGDIAEPHRQPRTATRGGILTRRRPRRLPGQGPHARHRLVPRLLDHHRRRRQSGGTHVLQLLNILEHFDLRRARRAAARPRPRSGPRRCKLVFADRGEVHRPTRTSSRSRYAGLASQGLRQGRLPPRSTPDAVMKNPRPPATRPRYEIGLDDALQRHGQGRQHGRRHQDDQHASSPPASSCRAPASSWATTWTTSTSSRARPTRSSPASACCRAMSPDARSSIPQGRPFMAVGSPGATRIIPTLAQVDLERDRPRHADPGRPSARRASTQGRTGNLSIEGRYLDQRRQRASWRSGTRSPWRPTTTPRFGGVHAVLFDHAARTAARRRRSAPRRPGRRLLTGADGRVQRPDSAADGMRRLQ